jgi:hypothetical protein
VRDRQVLNFPAAAAAAGIPGDFDVVPLDPGAVVGGGQPL